MPDLMTVAYVVAFFALFVVPMLYLTWKSLGSDVHSPGRGDADAAADAE